MTDREAMRLYARAHNFPNKVQNLKAKIGALRDEALELGFRDEHAHLAAMAVFANCWGDPPKPQKQGWSTDDVLQLKRLWLEGKTAQEIANSVGKSRAAVCKAARAHNLPRRRAA